MKVQNILLGIFFFIVFFIVALAFPTIFTGFSANINELGTGAFILLAFLSLFAGFIVRD